MKASDSKGLNVVLHDQSLREIVIELVTNAGYNGITVREMREVLPERHHGHVSGVASTLHKKGTFSRLTEERDDYQPYLLPEYVLDRPTEEQGWGNPSKAEIAWMESVISRLEYWFEVTQEGTRIGTDQQRVDRPGNRPLFVQDMRDVYAGRP